MRLLRRVVLVAFVLGLVAAPASAALAVSAEMASNAGQGQLNADALTYAFDCNSCTLLVVGASWGCQGGHSFTNVGATFNGTTMTKFVSVGYDGAGHDSSGVALFYLLTPSSGSHNVVVTNNNCAFTPRSLESGAIGFTGNDTTTPIVAGSGKTNFKETNDTNPNVTTATTTTGNIVVAQMATGSAYSSTTQTLSWSTNFNTGSAGGCAALTRTAGTGSTINMSDTVTSDFWGIAAMEVAAAAGGGGATCVKGSALSVGAGC